MLDENKDMRTGDLFEAFSNCNLHEAIIQRHGFNGCFFKILIMQTNIRFVGLSFIDDTDLIQTPHNDKESVHDVISKMQLSMNTWEGGLWTTDGAIVPKKVIGT